MFRKKVSVLLLICSVLLINLSLVQCAWLPKFPGFSKSPPVKEEPKNQLQIRIPIGSETIYINSDEVTLPSPAAYINDRGSAMVSLKFISDIIAAKTTWIAETKEIMIEKDNKIILLQINRPFAMVNDEIVELTNPPEIKDERSHVPLKFVSQQFGFLSDWIAESKTIILIKNF